MGRDREHSLNRQMMFDVSDAARSGAEAGMRILEINTQVPSGRLDCLARVM